MPFTVHRDGWVRWYKGRVRFVCSKTTPLVEVEDRWIDLKRKIDREEAPRPARIAPGAVTLRLLAGEFLSRQEARLKSGIPRKLAPHTYRDHVKTMGLLRNVWGADCDILDLEPKDFEKLLRRFGTTPSTVARNIAYVRTFFKYCHQAGLIPALPMYGPDFVRPPTQHLRDRRLSASKAYTPKELRTLWAQAKPDEKCWIGLGLNGAFDNSDIASLTRDAVDLKAGVIDFRRRKTGKIRRVVPLVPELHKLLTAYKRPEPASEAWADRFFLSAEGLPLVRIQPSAKDPLKLVEVDSISMRWKRLLSRAGLRPITIKQKDGIRKETHAKGDGRGFRSLRTTFSNLAPHGYREEIEIIMGHAHGSVLLDNYLESVGMKRLKQLTKAVWKAAIGK